MDEYLESLVEKTDGAEVESVEEVIVQDTEIKDADEIAESETEISKELETTADNEIEKELEVKPEEKIIESKPAEQEKNPSATNFNEGPQFVTNMKIYNVPDTKTAFRMYTGNIIVKDSVSDFKIVEYMRPGFGLVKGYIQ